MRVYARLTCAMSGRHIAGEKFLSEESEHNCDKATNFLPWKTKYLNLFENSSKWQILDYNLEVNDENKNHGRSLVMRRLL